MSDPYAIKAGEIYAVELDRLLSPDEMETMRKQWEEATGAKVIFLLGAKLVRTASDADEAIQRVRTMCDITLNLIDRQGSGGEEDYDLGYATAMRDVLNALDGEKS